MTIIKAVLDKELLTCGVKYYHSVDFAKAPHIMTIGGTGSGKTYLNQLIVAKVSIEDKYAQGTILDFKGQDYHFAKGTKRLYEYDRCLEGLEVFYDKFTQRQLGKDTSTGFRLLVIEELGSMLSFYNKKQVESIKSMIATLVLMGRSFNVHCLISTQRPDASYFSSGVRDSIAVVIALGNLSKEGKSMLFKDYEENMFPLFSIGAGYMLINGSEFTAIQVPRIKYIEKMESCIQDILDR